MSEQESKEKLVVVIGAGASAEAGLPTGAQLIEKIASALDIECSLRRDLNESQPKLIKGDSEIVEAFRFLAFDSKALEIELLINVSRRIAKAMPHATSIDKYIHSQRGDPLIAVCGKIAIVRCILQAESESPRYVEEKGFRNTWYQSFFNLLWGSCDVNELKNRLKDVIVISFNYDRCLEHYLHFAVREYYHLSSEDSADVLSNLKIFHPYGKVGVLPWMKKDWGDEFPPNFAQAQPSHQLVKLSGQIKTFTESIGDNDDISKMRTALASAKKVIFLGFAFDKLNMELLFPSEIKSTNSKSCQVYATAWEISQNNINEIKAKLARMAGYIEENIEMPHKTKCAELFKEYSGSLSLNHW